MRLYDELVDWYGLVDPPADHAEEAAAYARALSDAAAAPARTLLELGSGAGHNALFMKQRFQCTLTDLSPKMLALSRTLNPECEHALGDMRTVRLDRRFDAVFVHDAICYITTQADLRRVADTAWVHTRPGGAALFAPDYVRERFQEKTSLLSADDGSRSLRGLEWAWDPDPSDTHYAVEYAFALRDGGTVTFSTDHHDEGLFPTAVWMQTLTDAGYDVSLVERLVDEDDQTDCVFVCRRPSP